MFYTFLEEYQLKWRIFLPKVEDKLRGGAQMPA